MENLREYLNSFTKEDYDNKKINLHIHTSYSDGLGNEFQIASLSNCFVRAQIVRRSIRFNLVITYSFLDEL